MDRPSLTGNDGEAKGETEIREFDKLEVARIEETKARDYFFVYIYSLIL